MLACDLLVVGAGPVGCVVAERCANELDWRVLIVEKRRHVAGNCFDRYHESGIFIHEYGPHYYRTNSTHQLQYLSRFTPWIEGKYIVQALVNGELYPFPVNLTTLEKFFNKTLDWSTAPGFLESLTVRIENPSNSEEMVLSRMGKDIYEAFFKNFTLKHWGLHPRDLDPSVCGRIPIRLNRDPRYVDHKFQLLPKHGYTRMFENMIDHPNIKVLLNCQYRDIRDFLRPSLATVYSGPLDEYFDYEFGRLPYRSLRYEYELKNVEFSQPCVQINYPNDFLYTRSLEYKHLTGQEHRRTLVCYEYPESQGEPFYPIPSEANHELAHRYELLAEKEKNSRQVFFAGRLAEYKYYNLDQVIDRALDVYRAISSLA